MKKSGNAAPEPRLPLPAVRTGHFSKTARSGAPPVLGVSIQRRTALYSHADVAHPPIASGSPTLAATATLAAGVTGDAGKGFTNLLRTGESVGSLPENATSGQIATAVAEEGGRVGGTILAVVAVGGSSTPATAEQGASVAGDIGRNRVMMSNGSEIDLAGKAHFEKTTGESVATPHIKDPAYNTNPNTGVVYRNGFGPTRAATVGEVNAAARQAGAAPPTSTGTPLPVVKKDNQ